MRSVSTAIVGLALLIVTAGVGAPAAQASLQSAALGAPGAPTRITVTGAAQRSVDLTWRAPASSGASPLSDFAVEYRKVGESQWSTYAHQASSAASARVSGLSAATLYDFRLRAVNSAGSSPANISSRVLTTGDLDSCAVLATGAAKCWGDNSNNQGNVATLDGSSPESTVVSMSAGLAHSCAVLATGAAKCWGAGLNGRLGDGLGSNSDTPGLVSGLDGTAPATSAVAISVGAAHSCAVLGDGSATCWGASGSGQLGDGSRDDSFTPVPVMGLDGATPSTTAVAISAGSMYTCAVLATGTAVCWGSNVSGRLGSGVDDDSLVPVVVAGFDGSTPSTSVVSIATGTLHACAVVETGAVVCWGANFNGQLGDGQTTTSNAPVAVSGIDGTTSAKTAVAIAVGDAHSCAIRATGAAACWGGDDRNELGAGTGSSPVPVGVAGIHGATLSSTAIAISSGGAHTCVILGDGSAACWGMNTRGELGDGTNDPATSPVSVAGIDGLSLATSAARGSYGLTAGVVAPGAPTSVSAGEATTSSLRVTWTAPEIDGGAVVSNYVVTYRVAGSSEWVQFPHDESAATSIVVTGLEPDTQYEFAIAAVNTSGTGTFGVSVTSCRTQAGAPGAPTDVGGLATTASDVRVRWTAPVSTGKSPISDYQVQYRKDSVQSWSTFTHDPTTAQEIVVTGLAAATTYVFRVAAVNSAGPGAFSATSDPASTLWLPGAPGMPTIGARTSSTVRITWSAATSRSTISNYVVQFKAAGGSWQTFVRPRSTGLSATVTGLAEGSQYIFRVMAVSVAGTGPASAVSAGALAASAPDAPTRMSAQASKRGGEIAVAWGRADVHGAGFARYTVSWQAKGGKWHAEVDPPKLWSFTISGLVKGLTYSVRVTVTTSEGSASATKSGIVVAA